MATRAETAPPLTWANTWQYVAALTVCSFFGYYAFVRAANVPLISFADLGFHELGHFVTYFLPVPDVVSALMGSLTQVLVPWSLAAYFLIWRRDRFGGVFCLAWSASSFQNASVYIADAPYEALPLVGGHHDWAFILGPSEWGLLDRADEIAAAVKFFGIVLLFCAAAVCVVGPWLDRRSGASGGLPTTS